MPLFIVSTPIGNLQDITYRAVETLQKSAYILAEDTRHSRKLLQAYEIATPLKSYHKFNERQRVAEVIADLTAGLAISLISDAGTPLICDPGAIIIQEAYAHNLPVTVIPGPCAVIAAVTLAGLDALPFQFVGFLPRTQGRLQTALENALSYKGVTVAYESAERLLKTVAVLESLCPTCQVIVTRELTKHFEELKKGTPGELLALWEKRRVKGECVLLLSAFEKCESMKKNGEKLWKANLKKF